MQGVLFNVCVVLTQLTSVSAVPFDELLMTIPAGLLCLLRQRHHCRSTGCMLQCDWPPLLLITIVTSVPRALPSMALPHALYSASRLGCAVTCAVNLTRTLACAETLLLRCHPLCCAVMGAASMMHFIQRLHCCMAAQGSMLPMLLLLLLLIVVLMRHMLHSLAGCNRLHSHVKLHVRSISSWGHVLRGRAAD